MKELTGKCGELLSGAKTSSTRHAMTYRTFEVTQMMSKLCVNYQHIHEGPWQLLKKKHLRCQLKISSC